MVKNMRNRIKSITDSSISRTCIGIAVSVLLLFIAGCASTQNVSESRQYLDTGTGITVTSLDSPIIFYHDDPRIAANSRDYLYVGPVALNRAGKVSYYLWFGNWSMIDRLAGAQGENDSLDGVVVFVDGKPMEMNDQISAKEKARVKEHPYSSAVESTRTAYMRVSLDQINSFAAAQTLVVQIDGPVKPRTYMLWKGDVGSFASFADKPDFDKNPRLVKMNE
jgi:hypothetical protein